MFRLVGQTSSSRTAEHSVVSSCLVLPRCGPVLFVPYSCRGSCLPKRSNVSVLPQSWVRSEETSGLEVICKCCPKNGNL